MFRWLPYELHTHTNHSDGKQTIEELSCEAKKLNLYGFAMTDHNTISTFNMLDNMSEKYQIDIIPGMEWTTFYGHILLLGLNKYVEWRDVNLVNINEKIENIRNYVKLIGIAHPFSIGGPISTGSHFEYKISDYNNIDYIEVWSGLLPGKNYINKKAFDWWTSLLNKGYKISAVSGRDWHHTNGTEKYISCTYLGHKDNEKFDGINSIKKGKISVGCEYFLDIICNIDKNSYYIGDSINKDQINDMDITIMINESKVKTNYKYDDDKYIIKLVTNNGEVYSNIINNKDKVEVRLENIEFKWIRGELYRNIDNEEIIISFTNPVYFK